jgi:hypothetical protein
MKLTGTRVFLEVRVGPLHSVEVVLHVRACDRPWFESLSSTNASGPLPVSLMDLLEKSILPRWFTDDIVQDMSKHLQRKAPPPVLGPGGVQVVTGEANVLAQQKKQQQTAANAGKKGKRRRGGAKAAAAAAAAAAEQQRIADAKKKDVYYAVSETMQIAYRLQEIATKHQSVQPTLVFTDKIKMQSLIKLPRRILLWCSPPTSSNATANSTGHEEESDKSGGFYRPEFIPMASIFRAPRDEQDDKEDQPRGLHLSDLSRDEQGDKEEDRQPRAKKKRK